MLPPRVAPIQAIICPIVMKTTDQSELIKYAQDIKQLLKQRGVRADTDLRLNYTPGWKFNHWEQKGVPLRLEVGPRDLAAGQVRIVRRDNAEKVDVALTGLGDAVVALLDEIQSSLLTK